MNDYMSDTVGAVGAEAPDTADRTKVLREIYTAATARLRDQHADEFNKIRADLARERGVEWNPRPSAEDKAREQLRALLADHPDLATELHQP